MTADGLAATEELLIDALDGIPGSLREPCRRIAAAGNRLCAGLVLAVAGRAWPGTSRRTATAAAAIELLHLATRVHDDLRDDLPVRDGVPTINAGEGTTTALLAGDLLIGLATRLAATAGTGPALGEALTAVCAGQALAAGHRSAPR
jgi:heptaprenyl diphosphate synthase